NALSLPESITPASHTVIVPPATRRARRWPRPTNPAVSQRYELGFHNFASCEAREGVSDRIDARKTPKGCCGKSASVRLKHSSPRLVHTGRQSPQQWVT